MAKFILEMDYRSKTNKISPRVINRVDITLVLRQICPEIRVTSLSVYL